MNAVQCVISGCTLVDGGGATLLGDLYECGEAYVFVGPYDAEEGVAAWKYGEIVSERGRAIWCLDGSMFQRRGVVVFHKSKARLSRGAEHYLRTGERLP
jgi:hypothetical protein